MPSTQSQPEEREEPVWSWPVNLCDSASIRAWGEQFGRDVEARVARRRAEHEAELKRREEHENRIINAMVWPVAVVVSLVLFLLWS